MAQVSHCVRRAVTTLLIDNPPIQALSHAVIEDIHKKLEQIEKEKSTEAVIIMGKNGIFSAGADINGFSQMRFGLNQTEFELSDLIDKLDSFKKPIVAYIQRYAFGGGLEVALGCHYRLAEVGSKVGLPEVKIGLIPGAQGTQRLPRLIGPRRAIEMAVWGHPISAEKALEYGVIDKVISPDSDESMDRVYDFVETLKGKPIPTSRRLSQVPIQIPTNDSIDVIMSDTRRAMGKQMQGAMAPLYALRAIEAAMQSKSYQSGVHREKELFAELLSSGQSAALQYAFQAGRKAMKLPRSIMSAVPIRVSTVGIVGGGTMGQGIATVFLTNGFKVMLLERDSATAERAEQEILGIAEGSRELGKVRKLGKLQVTTDPKTALSNCDLVIEVVFEDLELKKKIFATMDQYSPKHAVLCSNTSSLNIDELAEATSRPSQVIGTHFFIPAYHMRPLEIVRGTKTSPETITTVHSLARAAGKVPFLVGNCFGFVGNRLLFALTFEAASCLLEGASPREIDEALEMFGLTIGPFATLDLAGMDVIDLIFKHLRSSFQPKKMGHIETFANLIDHLVHDLKRHGRKTGKGWYDYGRPGGKSMTIDPEIDRILEPFRNPEGRQPPVYAKKVSQQEIINRCVYATVNEGFKTLEEGIVTSPHTIDAMLLQAYGWPQVLGGPMYFASTVGLKNVLSHIEKRYKETDIPYLKPSEMLQKLVNSREPDSIEQWTRLGKL